MCQRMCETLLARYHLYKTANRLRLSMKFDFYIRRRIKSDIYGHLKFNRQLAPPPIPPPSSPQGHLVRDSDQRSLYRLWLRAQLEGWLYPPLPKLSPNSAKLLPSSLLLCSDKPDAVYFSGCRLRSCRSRAPLSCQSKPIFWQPQSPWEKLDPFFPFKPRPST